jgi:hypothetical protein
MGPLSVIDQCNDCDAVLADGARWSGPFFELEANDGRPELQKRGRRSLISVWSERVGRCATPGPGVWLGIARAASFAQTVSSCNSPCDASAVVPLGAAHCVVGNDETNTLRIHRWGRPQAVGVVDLSKFLGTRARAASDIEGAAAIGSRIGWITLHGTNGHGKTQPARHRLFETAVLPGDPSNSSWRAMPASSCCATWPEPIQSSPAS